MDEGGVLPVPVPVPVPIPRNGRRRRRRRPRNGGGGGGGKNVSLSSPHAHDYCFFREIVTGNWSCQNECLCPPKIYEYSLRHHLLNLNREREAKQRGCVWDRLSPPEPTIPSHRSLRGRLKWPPPAVPEDRGSEGRYLCSPPPPPIRIRRNPMYCRNTAPFFGPKSLSDLKSGKTAPENCDRDPLLYSFGGQTNSFEGPLPLAVILKRKREAGSAGVTLSQHSGEAAGAPSKKSKGRLCGSSGASATATPSPTCSTPAATLSPTCSTHAAEIAAAHAHNRKLEVGSGAVTLSQLSDEAAGAPSKKSKGRLGGSSGESATATPSPPCFTTAADVDTAYAPNGPLPQSVILKRKSEAGSGGVTLSQGSDDAAGAPSKKSKGRLCGSSGASATATPIPTCSTPAIEIATVYAHNRKEECRSLEDVLKAIEDPGMALIRGLRALSISTP